MPKLGTEINTVSAHMMSLEASTYAAMTQAQQAAANAAANVNHPSYTGTSVSSLPLAFGHFTVIVEPGKNWSPGMMLQLWNNGNGYMSGLVTSYINNVLQIQITSVTGAGTFSQWAISVLPSISGLTSAHVLSALGYEPVKPNGTGAHGVWNIHITGNAATVSTLTAAQIIGGLGYQPPALNGNGAHGTWPINVLGWAGAVDWANVHNRPTTLSGFANDVGYITAVGRAFPRRSDNGSDMNFHWLGQAGQPTWLWGSNDGYNQFVWNPANFSVARAGYADGAGVANSVHWNNVVARPVNVSQFGNDIGYAQASWVIANFFNFVTHVNHYLDPAVWGPDYQYCQEVSLEDVGGNLVIHRWYRNDQYRIMLASGGSGGH